MLEAWLLFIENDVEIGFEADESIVPLDERVAASKSRAPGWERWELLSGG